MSKERKAVDPEKMSRPRRFMWEHGRTVANVASLSRIPLAMLTRHYIKTEQWNKALASYAFIPITDKLDGTSSGLSKEGKTEFGGRLDELCDKGAQFIVEYTLYQQGLLSMEDLGIRNGRDVLMTVYQRPRIKAEGVSTSASLLSKLSTSGTFLADGYALTQHGRENEETRNTVHHIGTGGKVISFVDAPRAWRKREENKRKLLADSGEVYKAA